MSQSLHWLSLTSLVTMAFLESQLKMKHPSLVTWNGSWRWRQTAAGWLRLTGTWGTRWRGLSEGDGGDGDGISWNLLASFSLEALHNIWAFRRFLFSLYYEIDQSSCILELPLLSILILILSLWWGNQPGNILRNGQSLGTVELITNSCQDCSSMIY